MLNRRRALMAKKTETPILPAEYQQIEWIGSSKTGQFVSTNKTIGTATPRIELRYYKDTQAQNEQPIIMAAKNGVTGLEIGFTSTANRLFAFSSTSAQIVDPIVYGNLNDLTVKVSASSPYIEMTLKHGQTTLTGTKNTANNSVLAESIIHIFKNAGGALRCFCRLYSLKIYDSADNLLMNFVPCRRKSDSVGGFYDTVGEEFYASDGAYDFDKGADV